MHYTFMPLTISCSLISSNSNAEKFGRNESTFVCSLFAVTQPYKQMAISFVFLRSHNSLHYLTFHFSAVELTFYPSTKPLRCHSSFYNVELPIHTYVTWPFSKYRVIRKSLRDFRTRLRNNQDRHGRKEHINR